MAHPPDVNSNLTFEEWIDDIISSSEKVFRCNLNRTSAFLYVEHTSYCVVIFTILIYKSIGSCIAGCGFPTNPI